MIIALFPLFLGYINFRFDDTDGIFKFVILNFCESTHEGGGCSNGKLKKEDVAQKVNLVWKEDGSDNWAEKGGNPEISLFLCFS